MATNTPVVSTRCAPGGEEVLENGVYGKMCEVGDSKEIAESLLFVLQMDDKQLAHMIEKGKERAHTFSVERIVKQYETIFLKDRKSTRLNSSHVAISYAVFCLKKKKNT